jgi:hypothetical protein
MVVVVAEDQMRLLVVQAALVDQEVEEEDLEDQFHRLDLLVQVDQEHQGKEI